MAITRIHHHTFTVSDMGRSIQFYRDLLGFHLVQDVVRENLPAYDEIMGMQNVKVRVAMLRDPADEALVALLQYFNPPPISRTQGNSFVGSSILAVQTTDIVADHARLKAAGVRFVSDPVDVVREGKLAARIVYALDPDGMFVELYELPDAEPNR